MSLLFLTHHYHILSLSAKCPEVEKNFNHCMIFDSFIQILWPLGVGMGVMNFKIYILLLLMLHTKIGQDNHCDFIEEAKNIHDRQ